MVKIGNIELPEFPLLLAPMEDVSDPPFRRLCKEYGADMMYSEFVSSEGLIRDAIKSKKKLDIFDYERPIGIQIFGGDEDAMALSTEIVSIVKPDLVDINFGCPVKKVVSKGAGAGVLKDIDLMVRLTKACVRSTTLPVTVKTRLGWDDDSRNIVEVAERLQDVGIKALSIHGRTRSQMYKGEADWSLIEAVKNNQRMEIPIFGNGDIDTPEKAVEYKNRYGVDGIMIGRASIGNPWLFKKIRHFIDTGEIIEEPDVSERVLATRKHVEWSCEWKGDKLGILEMRRHYANYFKGLDHFKPYRKQLVTMNEKEEVLEVLDSIIQEYT